MKSLHIFCLLVLMLSACSFEQEDGKHLFILAGQSNIMAMNEKQSFVPVIESFYGKENILLVKHSKGNTGMHRWYKQWQHPEEKRRPKADEPYGDMYEGLLKKITQVRKDEKVVSITLVWLQGETDALTRRDAVYEKYTKAMIRQLKRDLQWNSLNIVVGRISDYHDFPGWSHIREVQVALANSNPYYTWINTDDLNDGIHEEGRKSENDLHYSKQGYEILGKRFAQAAIVVAERRRQWYKPWRVIDYFSRIESK